MNKIEKLIPYLLFTVVFVISVTFLHKEGRIGGVPVSDEYAATSTQTMISGGQTTFRLQRQLDANATVLGSVVVASSSGTTFKVWNANSLTDSASTSIAVLKAAVGEGTYTFDSFAPRGLIIEMPQNFNGDYVVTWR